MFHIKRVHETSESRFKVHTRVGKRLGMHRLTFNA